MYNAPLEKYWPQVSGKVSLHQKGGSSVAISFNVNLCFVCNKVTSSLYYFYFFIYFFCGGMGAQWLSGTVLYSRSRGRGFEPHRRHCVVSLSKTH